jgi:hypothetical protein
MAFVHTLNGFCDELKSTFPELSVPADRARTMTADTYWRTWSSGLKVLLERDHETLLGARGGFVIGAVRMTSALWSEISANTQHAIWRYLRTLALEAAMEANMEGVPTDSMQSLMAILTEERLEKGGSEAEAATAEMMEEAMGHMSPLMEKLKGLLGNFADLSGMPMPEIPERLRNGRIAKLAEEMAKQFDPVEFGIDPALLTGDNVEEVIKGLAEMYQRDPTKLIGGAKHVAEKIKKQILGGSLDRDALVEEAQEFVALFREHPLFKEVIGKLEGFMGGEGGGGLSEMFGGSNGGAPSERRRAVQERLRKKLAARQAAKK